MNGHCITLFGMTGVGKSFIGEHISKTTGWHFLDGDALFTEADIDHIKEVSFTEDMRDVYHRRLIEEIESLVELHRVCIVATCLVKQRHRELFLQRFKGCITLVYIYLGDALALQRMKGREHFFPPEKYLTLKAKFDPITPSTPCLQFDSGKENLDLLLLQLTKEVRCVFPTTSS